MIFRITYSAEIILSVQDLDLINRHFPCCQYFGKVNMHVSFSLLLVEYRAFTQPHFHYHHI